jgi:hypothetical protein
MNARCAIIVCDHGLGHVRRSALMAKEREKSGDLVTIFAPRVSVERLQRAMPYTMGLNIHDFRTHTAPLRIKQGLPQAVEWLKHLPCLDGFDIVICDNLPEILALRPDAIISAQFFWHDVIEGASLEYADYCEHLLALYEPIVIGCRLFAMDAVRKQPRFRPVGLYKNPELIAAVEATPVEQRTDLLVTGGTTPAVRNQLQKFLDELSREGASSFKNVHVDPELLPANPPDWMVEADFTVNMYCRLKAAVCRPGLGVVTDLLTVGARIITVYEEGNREVKANSLVLKHLEY